MFDALRKLFSSAPAATAAPVGGVDWKKEGNDFLETGDLAQAERCYRQAVEAVPGDATVHLNLGFTLLEQQQFDAARLSLGEAVRLDPGNHEAHFLLARAQRATGDAQAALQSYARVLGLQQDFTEAAQERNLLLTQLGQYAIDRGRPAEARDWFRQWVAAAPADPASHAHLGLACEWLDDMDAAEQAYRASLRLDGGHAQALFGLGNVCMHRGHALLAAHHYERVLAQLPDHTHALVNLAQALVACERYADAEARLEQLLALRPGDREALLARENCRAAQRASQAARRTGE